MTAKRTEDPATREALGGGLLLLTAVASGLVLAFLISRFVGTTYLTFLMPALMGWLVAAAVGRVAERFEVRRRLPIFAAAILGATIAYLGHQILAYTNIMDFLIAKLPSMVDRTAGNAADEVLALLEAQTGEQGLMAYIAFVAEGDGTRISPIGVAATADLGIAGTLIIMVLELATALFVAMWILTLRTRPVVAQAAAPTRFVRVLGEVDDDGVHAVMQHVEDAEFDEAGLVLAKAPAAATHQVAIEYQKSGTAAWSLRIRALGADGEPGEMRAERSIAATGGQALLDELDHARRVARTS